jgi:hypothetical protein
MDWDFVAAFCFLWAGCPSWHSTYPLQTVERKNWGCSLKSYPGLTYPQENTFLWICPNKW